MHKFLEYVPGDSLLHRMNPVAKLICAMLLALMCFVTSNMVFLLAIFVFDMLLATHAGMLRETFGLIKAVLAFSAILALIQILTTPVGTELMALPWGYVGTGSLMAAATTIVRLNAAAVGMFLTFYVSKIADITNSVVSVLHVPYKYAFTFTSTVNFIPIFLNDMDSIIEAQTARGVEFDSVGFVKKMRLIMPLCVPLLVSSVRKTNSAAIAAELRGFNLRTRTSGYKIYPFAARDVAALVLCGTLLVIAILLRLFV